MSILEQVTGNDRPNSNPAEIGLELSSAIIGRWRELILTRKSALIIVFEFWPPSVWRAVTMTGLYSAITVYIPHRQKLVM